MGISFVLSVIEILGISAFALSGIVAAKGKDMDLVGAYVLAMFTALGGGTFRDFMLGQRAFWLDSDYYPVLIFALTIASAPFIDRIIRSHHTLIAIDIFDALGIGLFTTVGASHAVAAGCPFVVSALMGVGTCILGGILRDIACSQIPQVLRRTPLYATCSFLGALVYLLINKAFPAEGLLAVFAGTACTFLLRIAAMRYKLKLPL
ncbi:MAG: hypothetical protein A2X49_04660 [Lentisphaerae bacterium GWF2_52_8]|nr:MAG: hypothetical protein A2X49_04660 [Lentisphaerae bacterium GWF2_52_8]